MAKQLPDLYDAPDETLAGAYVEIVSQATAGPPEDTETAQLATELDDLERELREMEPKVKRAQELRTQLAARDRRDEKRRKHAVELAAALPPILARLRPRYRPPYLDQVRQVAAADPEASLEAADTLLDLLNGERVSPEGAAEWVERGLEVLERNKEVGRGYFRLGSKYSLQVLEELKEGLALKSVARVLKLYATALSGHEVAIRGTNELQAVDAYGADHIILPPEMRFFEDDDGQLHRLQGGDRPRRRPDRVRHLRLLARRHPRDGRGACARATPRRPRDDPAPPRDRPHPLLRALPPAGAGAGPVQHRRGPPRRLRPSGRAYPGIRRDMALIQAASAERRPELATLPDAQAVVEALLQHTLGLHARPAPSCAPATQALIDRAVAMLDAVEAPEAPGSATPPRSPATSTS